MLLASRMRPPREEIDCARSWRGRRLAHGEHDVLRVGCGEHIEHLLRMLTVCSELRDLIVIFGKLMLQRVIREAEQDGDKCQNGGNGPWNPKIAARRFGFALKMEMTSTGAEERVVRQGDRGNADAHLQEAAAVPHSWQQRRDLPRSFRALRGMWRTGRDASERERTLRERRRSSQRGPDPPARYVHRDS